jgi:hypothetical protein
MFGGLIVAAAVGVVVAVILFIWHCCREGLWIIGNDLNNPVATLPVRGAVQI